MTDIGEGVHVPEPDEENKRPGEEPRTKIKIRYSIFIDGTLNNRTNVQSRKANNSAYQDAKGSWFNLGGTASYENDLSNVAIMEMYVDAGDGKGGYNKTFSSYIEGMGTFDGGGDSLRGFAFGWGESGVVQRARKGIAKLITDLQESFKPAKKYEIELLAVDVFGFSRGAASARNLIHQALDKKSHGRVPANPLEARIRRVGFVVSKIEFNFVGLYDTVSSVGFPYQHDSNSRTLNMDAVKHAKTVVQLAAADEHRENFSLTNIDSAGGKGKEVYLPGVHSDVGGGYVDGAEEVVVLRRNFKLSIVEADKRQLLAEGWFKPDQLHQNKPRGGRSDRTHVLSAKRIVKAKYHRIPLLIMAENAEQSGMLLKSKLTRDNAVPSGLQQVFNLLKSYAAKGGSKPDDWRYRTDIDWLVRLRNTDLHFSSNYGSTGMSPRIENEIRRRLIYAG